MRMIDGDALYEKTAEWEAQAFAYIEELNRTPLEEMTVEERAEWRRWTAILGERSAFLHDVADAPTIEPKHGRWIKKDGDFWECSECGQRIFSMSKQDKEEFYKWCGRCGARMDEVEE